MTGNPDRADRGSPDRPPNERSVGSSGEFSNERSVDYLHSPSNERSIDSRRPGDSPPPRAAGPDDGGSALSPTRRGPEGSRAPGGSNLVAVVASTTGFEAAVWVLLRYVPEYLQTMGVGAPLIGALGTLWLVGRWLGTGRTPPRRWRIAVGALAAAVGLTLWTLVPALADESARTAWAIIAVGAVGIAAWAHAGSNRTVSQWPLADGDGTATPDRPGWTLVALTVALVVLALARSFQAGYRVSLALAAALGVTVAALWAVDDLDVSSAAESSARPHVRASLGDVICRFGLTMVSLFVVVAVTTVLELEVVVFGRRLAPATAFGLFLVAELATAATVVRLGSRVVDVVGTRAAAVYASVVAAAFPLVLVTAPASPVVVGVVFVVYGSRSIGRVARVRAGALATRTGAHTDRSVTRVHETEASKDRVASGHTVGDRRALGVAMAPLVGGLLFAASPVLAFGAATAVGAVGAWELTRTLGGR